MSYRINKIRQAVGAVEADVYVVIESEDVEGREAAWDEGAAFVLEHIHGEAADVSEYNPYRESEVSS